MLVAGKVRAQLDAAHVAHIFDVAMQIAVPVQGALHAKLLRAVGAGELRLLVHHPVDLEPLLGVELLAALLAQMR